MKKPALCEQQLLLAANKDKEWDILRYAQNEQEREWISNSR